MSETKYSFLLGLQKAVLSASIFGLSLVAVFVASAYPELNNQPVVEAILSVVTPKLDMIFGSMTVGGVIALAVNFLKVYYSK